MKKAVSGALRERDARLAGGGRQPGAGRGLPGVCGSEARRGAGGRGRRPSGRPRGEASPRPAPWTSSEAPGPPRRGMRAGTLGDLRVASRGAEDGRGEPEDPAAQALSLRWEKPKVPRAAFYLACHLASQVDERGCCWLRALQRRKRRPREVESPAQGHTAVRSTASPSYLAPEPWCPARSRPHPHSMSLCFQTETLYTEGRRRVGAEKPPACPL